MNTITQEYDDANDDLDIDKRLELLAKSLGQMKTMPCKAKHKIRNSQRKKYYEQTVKTLTKPW